MHFSTDGLADIINGLIVNILSALLIFTYIWYAKKRPKIIVRYDFFSVGSVNMSYVDSSKLELILYVANHSIYKAYNFNLNFTEHTQTYRCFDYDPINLDANEEKQNRFTYSFFKEDNETIEDFKARVEKILATPIKIDCSFRNEENKRFKLKGVATRATTT